MEVTFLLPIFTLLSLENLTHFISSFSGEIQSHTSLFRSHLQLGFNILISLRYKTTRWMKCCVIFSHSAWISRYEKNLGYPSQLSSADWLRTNKYVTVGRTVVVAWRLFFVWIWNPISKLRVSVCILTDMTITDWNSAWTSCLWYWPHFGYLWLPVISNTKMPAARNCKVGNFFLHSTKAL